MSAAGRRPQAGGRRRARARLSSIRRRVLGADAAWSVTLVALVFAMVGAQRCGTVLESYEVGDFAREEIRAPTDLEVVDVELTEQRRSEARGGVADVYEFDEERAVRAARSVARMFASGRSALERGERPPPSVVPSTVRELAIPALTVVEWSQDVERVIVEAIARALRGPVTTNRAMLWSEPRVTVITLPGASEELLENFESVRDLDEARSQVRADLRRTLDMDESVEVALAELAAEFVDSNFIYDSEATKARRNDAAGDVPPVTIRIPRGTVLAEADTRIDRQTAAALDSARRALHDQVDATHFLGVFVLAAAFAFFLYRYASYHQRGFRGLRHLHALLVLVLLAILLLSTSVMWIVGQVTAGMSGPIEDVERYIPMVPVGASAVLIALLTNGRIAIVHSTFVSLLFGALNGWSLPLTIWALVVQWAGVYAVTSYRDRASLLRAGVVVGSAGGLAYLAVEAIRGGFAEPVGPFYGAALALVGGAVGTGLIVSFSLPLLEELFSVLTKIRLLELSNLDNPLLAQLALKAPGSYNHSLVVGTLAEEGAKSIGANSLFCRVAAFYHDVGKMVKPDYFVENQHGDNPHDRLSPWMSALILASHVKDGMRMARQAGVPEQIVDIIPQHHGTRLMTYFHERAKSSAQARFQPINEHEFRYPGPKPQTREAAIFMLADAVEAAARTVGDPTANRLREMIRRVTEAVVLDGQFDECDLTFADLERLQEAFLRTLVSMYHHRVSYPGFEFNRGALRERADGAKS